MRQSFCRLCCLVFFCWCLSYKSPAVISQHDSVTFATASYVHLGYILMEPSTVYWGQKSNCDCTKWSFNDMLHPKAHYDKSSFPTISTLFSEFSPKSCYILFSKASQGFPSAEFYWFLKSGSWNGSFVGEQKKISSFILAFLMRETFCLKYINISHSSFIAFTDILINPRFMWSGCNYIFVLSTKAPLRIVYPRSGHCLTW